MDTIESLCSSCGRHCDNRCAIKRREILDEKIAKLDIVALRKLVVEIHECLWDPYDEEYREVTDYVFVENVTEILASNGLYPEDANTDEDDDEDRTEDSYIEPRDE